MAPNLLVILADDMGWSDIGCFGGEIDTPVIDRLAAGGVRQTAFYNCARCCPTRASLLTGLHPHRAGIGAMVTDFGVPGYRGFLRPDAPTIAERLRAVGYRTWLSGKWHVGGEYPLHLPERWTCAGDATHPLPRQRGFDRFWGSLNGAGSYFDTRCLMDGDRFVPLSELPEGFYYTDEIGRRGAAFVDEALDAGAPFFGYLAFTAPHWPLHAPEADIARCRGRYAGGWDRLRAERLRRQIALGVVPPGQALSARDEASAPWETVPDQAWEAERMAVYAAQVEAMDRAIGVVVDRLRARGALDDTLILFLSDNGGCAEFLREDGEPLRWPAVYGMPTKRGTACTVGNRRGVPPGPAETFMSYDLPWANASNTPFRKFKAWTHEGGISTPLVAHWPRGLPAGALRHGTGHVVDLVATACALAGADRSGLAGIDLLPHWRDDAEPVRPEPLCWEHEGHAACRDGRWKIVRATPRDAWELYDIAADRGEEHDRAAAEPALVQRLAQAWQRWADADGVRGWPVV